MEPFRKKKLYEFKDQEIKKIPINDDIVALDAMVVSEDHNMLLVIVDKRSRDDLVKYLQIYDLKTYEAMNVDIELGDNSQPIAFHVCPK